MTANVTFVYAERSNVLQVANAALRFRPPPGMGMERRNATTEAQRGGARNHREERLSRKEEGRAGGAVTVAGAEVGVGAGGGAGSGSGRKTLAPDERRVWVLANGQAKPVRIKIGLSDGTVTEILSGDVALGDEIVTDATTGAKRGASGGGGPMRRIF